MRYQAIIRFPQLRRAFFRQFVYGPKCRITILNTQASPGAEGKTHIRMTITQSQVSDHFVMLVPIFGDFGKGLVRLGQLPVVGNSSKSYDFDFSDVPKKIQLNAYKEVLER